MPSEKAPGGEPNIPKPLSMEEFLKLKMDDAIWVVSKKIFPNELPNITGPLTIQGMYKKLLFSLSPTENTVPEATKIKTLRQVMFNGGKIFLNKEDAQKELQREAGLN